MTKKLIFLFATLLTFTFSIAQTTKPFDLALPADDAVIVLQGDKNTDYPLTWTSGKGVQTIGVNYDYSVFFDSVGGDISTPIDNITKSCCASAFQDTVLHFTGDQWASYLNGVSQSMYAKDFAIGDTLSLIWTVNLSAASSGPTYQFQLATSIFKIRFVRGQFLDEYVPVKLKNPSNFNQAFIQGNPNSEILFEWSAAYCPTGCAEASYDLLIDTVNGDFSVPYYSISIPNNDSSWGVNFNTFNQLLIDTRTPENASRRVYWQVLAYGNGQVQYSTETRNINLWNGLLDNENRPFSLINPINNATISLTGNVSTQLNFKWETTGTAKGNAEKYFLVFDTAFASPIFGKPIAQFETNNNSSDTAINLTYGKIDQVLDSLYPNWKNLTLMWGVKAQAQGTYYYPETPHFIEFRSGVMIGMNAPSSNDLVVYPNPASISVQLPASDEIRTVLLRSMQGKKVMEVLLNPGETQIDCSNLANGIYLIEALEGTISRKQLLSIQH